MAPTIEKSSDSLATRQSLLARLAQLDDNESWQEFFDKYWRLIYNAAVRAGLSHAEAEDVVQETIISVTKDFAEGRYSPNKGRFRSWLLNITRWRIIDQVRKRKSASTSEYDLTARIEEGSTERCERVDADQFAAIWDEEWSAHILQQALQRVKEEMDPKHYQAFDLCIFKEWPASKVAERLGMSVGAVYVAKHRVERRVKEEISTITLELN